MTDAELAQPVATERLRQQNTALVLRALRDDGPGSRAALATRTGLSKATVGTIVQALRDVGAVREDDPIEAVRTGQSGRPGRPVVLDGATTVGLGLEVNVDYLAATALDLSGRPVLSRHVPVGTNGELLAALGRLAADCLAQLVAEGRRVLGIAVAVPALVDHATGRVVDAPNLGWRDLDLAATVAAAVGGCPVRVDNDANCAATAEYDHGAARGATDALYLTGTVGLGAGLVVDGAVRRGAHGLAGEIGHTPFPGSPTVRCVCGRRGCWEASVGLRATLRAVGLGPDAGADPVEAAERVAALARRDPTARAAVRRVAADLGAGLVPLVGALDPEVVVLGGYFVPLGPWVLPVVRRALDRRRGPGRTNTPCRVVLSTLGLNAASTGAATDVLGDVYAGTLALG